MDTSLFIARRGDAARVLNAKVALLLSDLENATDFDKDAVNQEFIQFVNMIVVINEWDYNLVKDFGPTIQKMLAFQLKNHLGGTLTGSLTMRLQLPEGR